MMRGLRTERLLTDAELFAAMRDWMVASQHATQAEVEYLEDARLLMIIEEYFPGGIMEAVDHYSPRVPVEA